MAAAASRASRDGGAPVSDGTDASALTLAASDEQRLSRFSHVTSATGSDALSVERFEHDAHMAPAGGDGGGGGEEHPLEARSLDVSADFSGAHGPGADGLEGGHPLALHGLPGAGLAPFESTAPRAAPANAASTSLFDPDAFLS